MKLQNPPMCRGLTLDACAGKAAILSAQADQQSAQVAAVALGVDGFVALTAAVAAYLAWRAYKQTRIQATAALKQLEAFNEANNWQNKIALLESRPKITFGEMTLTSQLGAYRIPLVIKVGGNSNLYDVEIECEIRSLSYATQPPTEAVMRGLPKRTYPMIEGGSTLIVEKTFYTKDIKLNWDQGPDLHLDIEVRLIWKDEFGNEIRKNFISKTKTTTPFEPIPMADPGLTLSYDALLSSEPTSEASGR